MLFSPLVLFLILPCLVTAVAPPASPTSSPRSSLPGPFTDFSKCPEVLSCSSGWVPHRCCTHKWGVLKLAQQWVPGFGPPKAFTLHGLWPNSCTTGGRLPKAFAKGCDVNRKVPDISKHLNQTVLKGLETYWPSARLNNAWFWTHEWANHGTCYSPFDEECGYNLSQAASEYFQMALNLRQQYDFYEALESFGIPFAQGGTVSIKNIRQGIKKRLGVDVDIICDRDGQTLYEIRALFRVSGRSRYVPYNVGPEELETRCNSATVVIVPKYPAPGSGAGSQPANNKQKRKGSRT